VVLFFILSHTNETAAMKVFQRKYGWFVAIGLLSASFAGCGTDGGTGVKQLPVQKVEGTLVYEDGTPAGLVRIQLKPVAGGDHAPYADVDSQGKFRLSTYAFEDGAPPGEYTVSFANAMVADKTPPAGGFGTVIGQESQTGLKVTIKEGAATLEPIKVKKPGKK